MTAIKRAGYEDTIAGFYLKDEPYQSLLGNQNAMNTAHNNLKTVASWVKADLAKPVAVIISLPELHNATIGATQPSAYLSMFDWVGFDCYGLWTNCRGYPMTSHIARLTDLLGPSQRMIAVPQGSGVDLGGQDDLIQTNIDYWNAEVVGNPKYVLVVVWAWNQGSALNVVDLPVVKERFRRMAHSLLAPNTPYAPPAWKSAAPVLFR